jgi:hypothetical protein
MKNDNLTTLVEKLKQVLIEAEKVSLSKEQRTTQIINQRKKLFKFIIKYVKQIASDAMDNYNKVEYKSSQSVIKRILSASNMVIYYIDKSNDFGTAISQARSFLKDYERAILQLDNITVKENKITFDKLYNIIMEKL